MVHNYGPSESGYDVDVELINDTTATEASSLLGASSAGKRELTSDGHATIASGVGNLSNTIVGSGMLTFPLAMASSGLLPGLFFCAFSGFLAAFGLYLLSLAARKTPHRRSSFFAVAQLTFPRAAIFFDAAIAIKCFGVSISYLIIIKSLMPSVVTALYHDLTPSDTNPPDWSLSGHVWLALVMIPLVPISFFRKLDSLRHTSYIALFSVVYLLVVVIFCYFKPLEGMPARGEMHLIHFTPSFVSMFPVQVFGFTCAQNLFPIFNELKSNSQTRMNIVIGTSIGSAVGIYEVVAVFGYLTFGSKVGANIIAMYPSTTTFVAVGQLAIAILVMFSYPLQVHPCRNCLDKIFHAADVSVVNGDGEDDEVVDDHGASQMSTFKHAALSAAIIMGGFFIAYFVNDLQLILSFVGSTGSTTVSFILPGLFFWKLSKNDPNTSKLLRTGSLGLAIYGAFIFIFCLSYNIYQVVHRSGSRSLI